LKKKGLKVELAFEWIKLKLYEGTPYPFVDQVYTFGKQFKQINQLKDKVDYIVTDSPILLSLMYGKSEGKEFLSFVRHCYFKFDNVDFVLERDHAYQSYGRNQNEEESNVMQKEIIKVLRDTGVQYSLIKSSNAVNDIMKAIL